MKYSKKDISEAKEQLLRIIPKGSTVHTILRSCSRSGMSRCISLVVIDERGDTWHPNYSAAVLLGASLKRVNGSDAIRVDGCGMDMGFHIVYELSHILYGDVYALKHHWL